MIIESRFKLDHCCAHDDLRPILAYINVTQFEGVDVAVAADGYMMAVVPVKLEEGDVPGLIHSDVFRQARKLSSSFEMQIGLEAGTAILENGWHVPRLPPLKDYPNVAKVVDAARDRQPVSPHFALDPRLLRAVQKAIGAERRPVIISQSRHDGPLLISPVSGDDPFTPPFGILMPVHVGGRTDAASEAEPVGAPS